MTSHKRQPRSQGGGGKGGPLNIKGQGTAKEVDRSVDGVSPITKYVTHEKHITNELEGGIVCTRTTKTKNWTLTFCLWVSPQLCHFGTAHDLNLWTQRMTLQYFKGL